MSEGQDNQKEAASPAPKKGRHARQTGIAPPPSPSPATSSAVAADPVWPPSWLAPLLSVPGAPPAPTPDAPPPLPPPSPAPLLLPTVLPGQQQPCLGGCTTTTATATPTWVGVPTTPPQTTHQRKPIREWRGGGEMELLFREMHGAVSQSCLAVRDAIRRERDQLNPEIAFYEKMKNRIATVHIGSSIKLDVGGTVFRTSKSTLTKEPGSMLAAMFSGSIPPGRQDEDGTYFIDRSGKHFGTILNYLRTGVFIQPYDPVSVEELKVELDYYGILSKLYPQAVFVFSDSHDNNGLFYWIGCSMGSLPYTDPASKPNLVTVENGFHQAPSILIGHPTFGRDTPGVCGDAKGKSFTVKFTIKTWFFQPNYYTMSFSGKCVSSWTLYGSCDNGTTWENLSEILNITPNTSSCGSWPITTSHKFNQFRVTPAPMDTCFHAYGLELYGSLSS